MLTIHVPFGNEQSLDFVGDATQLHSDAPRRRMLSVELRRK